MCQPGRPRPHGDVPPGVLGRGLVGLPEREVARILLERARLLALLDLVGLLAGEPAVVREARDPEVDVAAGAVGVPGLDQLLDEVDDLRHALRRLRQPIGHAQAEVARVLEVPLRRARRELGARARRRVVDLVVDVGDVVHELGVVAGRCAARSAATCRRRTGARSRCERARRRSVRRQYIRIGPGTAGRSTIERLYVS